jgi:hypothetical protein
MSDIKKLMKLDRLFSKRTDVAATKEVVDVDQEKKKKKTTTPDGVKEELVNHDGVESISLEAIPMKKSDSEGTKEEDCSKETAVSKSTKREKMMSTVNKIIKVRRYIDSVFVRLVLLVVPSFWIVETSCIYQNKAFYGLYACCLVIVIDGVYVFFKRQGYDYYW